MSLGKIFTLPIVRRIVRRNLWSIFHVDRDIFSSHENITCVCFSPSLQRHVYRSTFASTNLHNCAHISHNYRAHSLSMSTITIFLALARALSRVPYALRSRYTLQLCHNRGNIPVEFSTISRENRSRDILVERDSLCQWYRSRLLFFYLHVFLLIIFILEFLFLHYCFYFIHR